MKTLPALAVAIVIAATAAPALAQESLNPTYLIHKLTVDGVQLRSLEPARGIYRAKVLATDDATVVKVGVDPASVFLTDAYSHAKTGKAKGDLPRLTAAEAIQAAAYTGYWDVRELGYKHGTWLVTARDDNGRSRTVAVDAASGVVN